MKKIYFVRHGLTHCNVEGKVQDETDSLTDKGFEQAEIIGDRLSRIKFDVLLSSDMLRAKQTADVIAKHTGHVPQFSPLFREAKYPTSHVGLAMNEGVTIEYPLERTAHWGDASWQYEDEENPSMLNKRAKEALAYIAEQPEDSIAVVTHGRFLRHIIVAVLLTDTATPAQEEHLMNHLTTMNTGITVLEYKEGEWRMLTWNDHAHLG